MKFTIHGFSQEKLIELGLDSTDALILRWFVDFKDTGDMATEIIENEQYYWIKYEKIVQDIPIAKLKTKDSVYRRLKKMDDVGILKHKTKKQGGTYSFYSLGSKYRELITIDTLPDKNPSVSDEKVEDSDKNPKGCGFKSVGGTDIYPEQKINLLNNILFSSSSNKEIFWEIKKVFDNNIHPMTPIEAQKLMEYIEIDGMDYRLIIRAIEIAVCNGKRTLNYIQGILKAWREDDLKTIEALEAHERDKLDRKKSKGERGQFINGDSRGNSQESNPYANAKKLKLGGR